MTIKMKATEEFFSSDDVHLMLYSVQVGFYSLSVDIDENRSSNKIFHAKVLHFCDTVFSPEFWKEKFARTDVVTW